MVEAGIAMAGIGFPDLDFVAVTRGPGSFQGCVLVWPSRADQALDISFGVTVSLRLLEPLWQVQYSQSRGCGCA